MTIVQGYESSISLVLEQVTIPSVTFFFFFSLFQLEVQFVVVIKYFSCYSPYHDKWFRNQQINQANYSCLCITIFHAPFLTQMNDADFQGLLISALWLSFLLWNISSMHVQVILVILSVYPAIIFPDFQLVRCILKILETVYLKFHKLDCRDSRMRSKSHCEEAPVVDLTEDDDKTPQSSEKSKPRRSSGEEAVTSLSSSRDNPIEILDDSSDDDKSSTSEEAQQEAYDKQLTDMLYEILQNFILDVISALAEVGSSVC